MKTEPFARNLRIFRIAKGYTQEDMGVKLNIQRQTYCNYENDRRLPNLEILIEISIILGVTLDMLIQETNFPASESLSDQEIILKLIIDYNSLPKSTQQQILNFISFQKLNPSNSAPS